ncbi:hypothetical protein MNEG_2200 [Monoraphidium neglectum]|uniref:Uncharacterized protein n=1 Tax=Monoraphidium neglectum TaxID=145388 RepID=A0A0D2LGZ5_9CHLO|nr:hypothetical protein MNEG_2200 [Monoraphidium neglectum]KIZ05764.1 hypothetical protein MNEG_2200 [Monoraphidium neglectum]|eukprot:XP_013904783.1 hypothetical protein MNEG_2200 [Monoraphidium neglectum]
MSQDEGTAVVAQDVAVDEVELGSAPSKKQLQKKERALAGALAGELSGELARLGSAVLDQSGGGTPAQRAWAKQKRRDLRQLTAKVADPGVPLEERLRLLQRALASEVEAHIAMEQRALAAEARTAAAKQQADADVAKANASAADSRELTLKLERLCRQMQEQLRVANEASGGWQKRYQLMERQVDALKEITSVSKQQHEALETRNAVLEKANESLRQQAEDLAERMGKHQQHLSAFEDIKAQIQEHGKMFETFDSMKDLLKRQSDEHTLLTTHLESKQQEVSELRDALEKAKQVIELQDATNKQARAEYDRQAKEYTQSVKNAKKGTPREALSAHPHPAPPSQYPAP